MNGLEILTINTVIFIFPILLYIALCNKFQYEPINADSKWNRVFTSLSFITLSIIFIGLNILFLIYNYKNYNILTLVIHLMLIIGLAMLLVASEFETYKKERRKEEEEKYDDKQSIGSDDTVKYKDYYKERRERRKELRDVGYNPYELRKQSKKYSI